MKTIQKVTLLIAFAALSNNLFSAGNLMVNILPVSSGKALIDVSTSCSSNFHLTVENEAGRIVYSFISVEPCENYHEMMDFANLENGKYNIIVVCHELSTVRQFRKSNKGISVGPERNTCAPVFGYKSGILRCAYLNYPKENLTLYFLRGNQLLYSKELGKLFNVNEAMNLSKLEEGNYEVVLSAGDQEHSFKIRIE